MKKTPSRQSELARVHVLAKSLSLDESRYRTILLCFTGQQSCRVLGAEKLQHLIAVLETMEHGNDPDNTPPRANGAVLVASELWPLSVQPTINQWNTLDELTRSIGWSGLRDSRMLAFVKHTTTQERLEAISRIEASHCITGLIKWRKSLHRSNSDVNGMRGK